MRIGKRKILFALILLFASNLFIVQPAQALNVTFSQTFTAGVNPSSGIVSAWETFRSQLTGSYNSFTWSSSNGASITVSDATKIQSLANALRLGSPTNQVIGANTWYVGTGCGSTPGYSTAVEFSNQGTCSCASGYNLRPLISNSNWGGSNGTTCGAATQTITLTFFDSAPDTTAPTITSSSNFNADENQTSIGTATANESVSWSKVGGVDSLTVTINVSTGLISFSLAPNYELPTDFGANNVYEVTIRATDTAGNITNQSITITVKDVLDTSSFNSFAVASVPTYRTVVQISANITVPSKVTFKVNNVRIPGCIGVRTIGSSPNIVATCNWKPSRRGPMVVTAHATPIAGGITSSSASLANILVQPRTGAR